MYGCTAYNHSYADGGVFAVHSSCPPDTVSHSHDLYILPTSSLVIFLNSNPYEIYARHWLYIMTDSVGTSLWEVFLIFWRTSSHNWISFSPICLLISDDNLFLLFSYILNRPTFLIIFSVSFTFYNLRSASKFFNLLSASDLTSPPLILRFSWEKLFG